MSDNAVAALAVFCIFGAPIGAFVIMRVLAHRERIEMIRRGMVPPPGSYRNAKAWRNAGEAAAPPGWNGAVNELESPDRSLQKGIRTALIGLALLIGLSFIGSDTNGPLNTFEIHPGPWLLGGLIPMFVGIARIITALLSGARLGPLGGMSGAGPSPYSGPYPGAQGAPPPDPAPYVYDPEPRTHSGYEELRRPTPSNPPPSPRSPRPPDRR